jgi:uncharacterized repeat protein (TIGR02543 family)
VRIQIKRGLLALALLSFLLPTPAQAATVNYNCGTSGTFQVDNVTNTVTGNTSCVGAVTIPEGVVAIATNAYASNVNLGAVSIPASMRTINSTAFNAAKFTSITIAEGLTTIGASAFANISSQVPITLPNSVTSMGDRIFDQAQMTTVSLGPNIDRIGDNTFYNNYGFGPTSVEFRGGAPLVTTLPTGSFIGYRGTEITLPINITSIGARAFDTLPNLRYLIVPDSVTSIGAQAFSPASSLKTVVLPSALTTLGATAFSSSIATVVYCGSTSAVQNYAYPNSIVPVCGKAAIFERNDGTGTMTTQVRSTPGTLTSNTFTRSGYVFTGWNTKANGTGTSYANSATYDFTNHTVLYAQWAVPDVTAPTFLTATSLSSPENQSLVANILINENATVSIKGGSDQAKFRVTQVAESATALSFIEAPNYESPTDSDTNNTYIVVLGATDASSNSKIETYTITITDAADQIAIIASTIPLTVQKGAASNISLTFERAVKATMIYKGKRIPGCISKASATSSPFILTCSFKSSSQGAGLLSISYSAISGINLGGEASLGYIAAGKRTNKR